MRTQDHDYTVSAGATNLFDKEYYFNVFDSQALGSPYTQAQPAPPRQWYLTISKNFDRHRARHPMDVKSKLIARVLRRCARRALRAAQVEPRQAPALRVRVPRPPSWASTRRASSRKPRRCVARSVPASFRAR